MTESDTDKSLYREVFKYLSSTYKSSLGVTLDDTAGVFFNTELLSGGKDLKEHSAKHGLPLFHLLQANLCFFCDNLEAWLLWHGAWKELHGWRRNDAMTKNLPFEISTYQVAFCALGAFV